MIALVLQQWRDRRGAALGWLAGWFVLVAMYAATWPTVRSHAHQYDEIMAGMPKAVRTAIGGGAFSTPGGYLTAELLGITGPLIALTMGVLLGVSSLAGEEQAGTLELLAAQPMTRGRLVLGRFLAGAAEIILVLVATALVLWSGGGLVGLRMGLLTCLRGFLLLALLALQGLGLGILAGALTGRAGRSRAIAGGVGLVAFLVATLGPSVQVLVHAVPLSPFHTLVTADPFRRVPPALQVVELVLPALVFVGCAVARLTRRDLRLS